MNVARLLASAALAAGLSAPALADPPHCPPGHAKKGWCTPGGPSWRVGQRAPRDRYVVIRDYDRHGWPRLRDGEIYVRIDRDVLLVAAATGIILDVLSRN